MEMPARPIEDTRLKKFNKVFTQAERTHLEQQLMFGGSVQHLLMFESSVKYLWPSPAKAFSMEAS